MPLLTRAAATLALLSGSAAALAQTSANIDMSGLSVSSQQISPADAVRAGTTTISAASGYRYTFNPVVRGTGFLGPLVIPGDIALGDLLTTFEPGMSRVTFGAMRNPSGAVPAGVYFEPVNQVVSGQTVNLTFAIDIQSSRIPRAAIRNITKPFGLGLSVVSGGATLQTWAPPAPIVSEWHFGGDLRSVRETGLAPQSGPSKLRYLDDPAFGAILGGPGQENVLPATPTPTGVTAAQSAFGATSSFGIPTIGGVDATVYRTSPTRNLADPTNQAKSRGIGLALFPNTADFWPDEKISQWTLIVDLYIPVNAWTVEYPVALIQDNHNNANDADGFIRQASGQGSFGFRVQPGQYVSSTRIGPGRWMRLAIAADSYQSTQSRVFVDGVFVGTSGAGWLYNSTKSTDPRFPDITSAQPVGTPVPAATWAGWGNFPSPWAAAPNSSNPAKMGSTVCLFADLLGRGEAVYVANLAFSDEAVSDAAISALGSARAGGIVYVAAPPCVQDFNHDGDVNPDDLGDFITCYFEQPPCAGADFNHDADVNPDDLGDFITTYFGPAC